MEKGSALMGIESLHRENRGEKWMDYMLGNDWSEAIDEQWKAIRSL